MLLVESQILPPIQIFIEALRCGGLLIEACENYQKKSLRNKFFTSSSSGRDSTSIPLKKGKANKTSISEVEISYDENWIHLIENKLKTSYGRSAYFDHYIDELLEILNKNFVFLFDLNINLLEWIISSTRLEIKYDLTESYSPELYPHVLDWRNKNLSFYNCDLSNNRMVYNQIFESQYGFIRNLSIIDLLFNRGPESGLLLKEEAKNLNIM